MSVITAVGIGMKFRQLVRNRNTAQVGANSVTDD